MTSNAIAVGWFDALLAGARPAARRLGRGAVTVFAAPSLGPDGEDLLYSDGYAAAARGDPWSPPPLPEAARTVWTDGYRAGRHARTTDRTLPGLPARAPT